MVQQQDKTYWMSTTPASECLACSIALRIPATLRQQWALPCLGLTCAFSLPPSQQSIASKAEHNSCPEGQDPLATAWVQHVSHIFGWPKAATCCPCCCRVQEGIEEAAQLRRQKRDGQREAARHLLETGGHWCLQQCTSYRHVYLLVTLLRALVLSPMAVAAPDVHLCCMQLLLHLAVALQSCMQSALCSLFADAVLPVLQSHATACCT